MSNPSEKSTPFFVDLEVIVLNRNGVWLSDGVEISHEPTRALFSRIIRKKPDGYYLEIGRERKQIEVEDTAYFVTRIDVQDAQNPSTGFSVTYSNGTTEPLAPETLSYQPPSRLTCLLQTGPGKGEEARFLSAPYFDLLQLLEENAQGYFLSIQGKTWILASKVDK